MHLFSRRELADSAGFAFVERRAVRFQDIDAAGIVFHVRMLEYFHDAYLSFLSASGSPLHESLKQGLWAAPLRHVEADYFKPLRFGDAIDVALVAAHVQATEVTIGYRVKRAEGEEVIAVGQTVHVFVDAKTFRRTDIPDLLRSAFLKLGHPSQVTPGRDASRGSASGCQLGAEVLE
jgi:YbgC/YbaW family acyl-CoA thioester hydrolase